MCGIVGRLNFDGKPVDPTEIKSMCQAIKHRGPDAEGIWINKQVGLGSRRLSIIDLSPKGSQPIKNETGSIRVVLNGEIYNYVSLRKKLIHQGHKFYSQTDTETIVHLWEEYGIGCVKWLRGMFAFALWDEKQQVLFLARDRLGKKPLKYWLDDKSLIFASELKAILFAQGVNRRLDLEAIDHYFCLEAVPEPLTGFKKIFKLPAGSYLIFKNNHLEIKSYWKLNFLPKLNLSQKEWQQKILGKLTQSVKLRLIADVPVGAFLSGGIDSSLIVALMHQLGQKKINTFSVGFEDNNNELPFAKIISEKFSTNHHELILKPQNFNLLEKLAETYEEPYGDPSALPSFLVSRLASQSLKVVLNGDGGDENFAGYQRYPKFIAINKLKHLMVGPLKNWLKWWLKLSQQHYQLNIIEQPDFGTYASAYLATNSPASWKQSAYQPEFLHQVDILKTHQLFLDQSDSKLSALDNALKTDFKLYLGQVLLPKMDLASMANGLEVRSPFLDQEMVELAAKIPVSLKLKGFNGKYILKQLAEKLIPQEIINRPKMGFSFPLGRWLRDQWQDQVKQILFDKNALSKKLIKPRSLNQMVNQPLTGEHFDRRLYRILMLELWLKHYFPNL